MKNFIYNNKTQNNKEQSLKMMKINIETYKLRFQFMLAISINIILFGLEDRKEMHYIETTF